MGLLHPQHLRLMLTSSVCPSPERPSLFAAAAHSFVVLRDVIVKCQEAGVIGSGDPYHRAMHCWMLVNGFTTLFAEGRLEWTGITHGNAREALRIFLKQYMVGAVKPIPLRAGSFTPFNTEFAAPSLKFMTEIAGKTFPDFRAEKK